MGLLDARRLQIPLVKSKPYLLSVGIGFPLFGLWGHWYRPVRKKRKLKHMRFLGIQIIYTTYNLARP